MRVQVTPLAGEDSYRAHLTMVKQKSIGVSQLRHLLASPGELAVLDVRQEGHFSRGHLLEAVSAPLARLELIIDRLVPRLGTPIVVVDQSGELATDARARLESLGYRDVRVLAGGTRGWIEAGYVAVTGTNVPGKMLGELVEHQLGTPVIEPSALKRLLDEEQDVVVLDSRTFREFRDFSIPGGISCPTAELVYRFFEVVKSPDTIVVVNCAGRTRSIIGAQTLINAGVPNTVLSLKNSTMGWLFAGLALEHGNAAFAPSPSPAALSKSRVLARAMAANAGVRGITREQYAHMQQEVADRTLYTFDVRTPGEYLAGHVPGVRSAEGGQLVQALDDYVGTRNARIVLVDHDGIRAHVVASWLRQLGRDDVFVLDAMSDAILEVGHEPIRVRRTCAPKARLIDPITLKSALDGGNAAVVDVESTLAFRDGHIPGAIFSTRERVVAVAKEIDAGHDLVITSADGVLASVVADDLLHRGHKATALLGGTQAWAALGLQLVKENGAFRPDEDVWYGPYTYPPDRMKQAFQTYIDWEMALVEDAERIGTTGIRPRNLSLGPSDLGGLTRLDRLD